MARPIKYTTSSLIRFLFCFLPFSLFAHSLFMKLGIYIPLIVVNCIPMGRAEAFASRYGVVRSTLDGLGLGIGYTLALSALAIFREIIATGSITFYETPIAILGASFEPFKFLVAAPGAFICLGLMLGIMNILGKK